MHSQCKALQNLVQTSWGWVVLSWVELSLVDVKSYLKLSWNNLLSKKFCGQKSLVKTFISPKNFGSKQIGSQKMLGQKDFGSKKIWLEKFWSKEILCPKYFGSKKIFGQKEFWSKKLRPPQNWVIFGSGTTELFMIWKKVVSTNIACTNVTVTFGIKYGPWNLPLKFGWNCVSISWDIPDMDKCRQDKYYLNKCHRNS